jgi:hypothetical protein
MKSVAHYLAKVLCDTGTFRNEDLKTQGRKLFSFLELTKNE